MQLPFSSPISQQWFRNNQGAGSGGSGIAQFGQGTPFSAPPGSVLPDMADLQASPQGQALRATSRQPAMATLQPSNPGQVMSQIPLNPAQPMSQSPASSGIGGLFAQRMGNQGGQPLQQYGEYLNTTYAMPQIEDERQKISEFLEMVNRAEQAHFANLA